MPLHFLLRPNCPTRPCSKLENRHSIRTSDRQIHARSADLFLFLFLFVAPQFGSGFRDDSGDVEIPSQPRSPFRPRHRWNHLRLQRSHYRGYDYRGAQWSSVDPQLQIQASQFITAHCDTACREEHKLNSRRCINPVPRIWGSRTSRLLMKVPSDRATCETAHFLIL